MSFAEISEISFERPFQVWFYTVGHSQLLLRSNRSGERGTRVDVLFKGVKAIQLPTVLQGLRMVKASRPEALQTSRKFGIQLLDDEQVFMLEGANYVGFVIGLVAFAHEDEGHHNDPTFFANSFIPGRQP